MEKATSAVADFVYAADIATFPADVVAQGTRCVLDGIGVMLAGSASRAGEIVRSHVLAANGTPESTVIGRDALRAPASLAARANAVAGHALDFDDTQLSNRPDRIFGLLTHPTVPALAAALALGERLSVSGARFLEAFLVGFEVECKIAEAIDPEHYQRGFHSSGTIGTFGAAATAAKLLGLDPERTAVALSIAASMSSGIRVNFGTMTKPLHVGRAAENGVLAAELASAGFTADPEGLDGPWGFFQVFGGGFDAAAIIGRLGSPYSIVDPGVSAKPYPCGSLAQPSMDAMLDLVTENDVRPEQIRTIRLRAGSNILEPLRYGKAQNELEAKFSIPFVLSSIALRRKAGINEFADAFVHGQAVQRMMDRVERVLDPDIEAQGFDRMRSIVEIDLDDGRTVRRHAEVYRGGPERPLTREELHAKFTECAALVLESDRIGLAIDRIESLTELATIAELIGALERRSRARV